MLSFKAEGERLVLAQINMPDLVDSPWEPLQIGRNRKRMGSGEARGAGEGVGEAKTVVEMQNSFLKICDLKKTNFTNSHQIEIFSNI